jgi:histidinol-phosphatase
MTSELKNYFEFALDFVQKSNDEILKLYNSNFATEFKSDNSPVTDLDKKIEENFRDHLSDKFPSHGLVGEEFGVLNKNSNFQWIIDPIDGTLSLVNRVPTFGTMISLRIDNEPVLGIIHHPALGITISGFKGNGVNYVDLSNQSRKILISNSDLTENYNQSKDMIGLSAPSSFGRNLTLNSDSIIKVVSNIQNARIYFDCFGLTHLASFGIKGYIEANARIWDLAASEFFMNEIGLEYIAVGPAYDGSNYDSRFSCIMGTKSITSFIQNVLK